VDKRILEFFECGQGYYQDEAEKIVLIDNKSYCVKIKAEICSAKQNIGDRLCWVENLESVTYSEIPKPEEKMKITCTYNFSVDLLEEEQEALEGMLLKYGVTNIQKEV
jgi:hypothetical protein